MIDNTMIKISQKSSETVKDRQYNDQDITEVIRNVKDRQYNDQDTTEVITNRKGQTIQ